jgi:hypothetical protein
VRIDVCALLFERHGFQQDGRNGERLRDSSGARSIEAAEIL